MAIAITRHRAGMGHSHIAMAVITAALVASPAMADSKTTSSGDVVTVTGASVSIIEITLASGATAQATGGAVRLRERNVRFGTNLAPDGPPSDSPDEVTAVVDPSDPSSGACYAWAGAVTVRSNRIYTLKVSSSTANPHLTFLVEDPTDFATCAGGQVVGPTMFSGADPAGAWVAGQGRTPGRSHRYWLGLQVLWTDAPSSTLADATLTFTAAPSL